MKSFQLPPVWLFTLLVSACGQPGPLYLPEEAPPEIQTETQTESNRNLQTPPQPEESQPETQTYTTQ